MNDERWGTVDRLFGAALEKAPDERAAFLREACAGDEALRGDVESLLAHDSRAVGFLSTPGFDVGKPGSGAPFVGRQVGPYTIQAPLGVGGMGEVYRARDGTLGRDVAIKILPRIFNTDPDRRARFDREARLLAALNHPHIGAIYGVEESEGIRALVLELVEGDTLADRLARGPIPVGEALHIARQIAAALEAAHEKGIIHRDLKPANIKITPEGIVKVLDFGLAKAARGDASGLDLKKAPTLTIDGTRDGVILGTAAYMSPEQARGKPVDKRADIWAFGCVLYELLTGRAAVTGETLSDMLATILEREPDWQALPSATPGKIQDLLRRCLQKDSHRRLRDIGDARIEIEDVLAAGVITSIGGWAFRVSPPASAPSPVVTRFTMILPPGQRFQNTSSRLVDVSPNGKQVVYVANGGVYGRPMSKLEATVIPGTESLQASHPVFSPDSLSVALYSASDRTVKRIPLSGGAAVTIGEEIDLPYGMSWGEGGILVGQTGKGIVRVLPDGGGTPDLLVTIKPGEIADGPQMLPGGKSVLFALSTTTGSEQWDRAQIVVQTFSSGKRTRIIQDGSDARYLPSGHIVYAIGGSLFAVPFDLQRLQVTGESAPVVKGVRRTPRGGSAQFSYSDTGTLIYLPGPAFSTSSQRDLVLIGRKGGIEPLKVQRGAYESPRVSPDGTRIAVSIDTGREANIWIHDLTGTRSMRRLTSEGRNRFPVWSSDSQWVAFQSDREGDLGIFRQRADANASGRAERLTRPDQGTSHIPESWSRTERVFSFSAITATDASLWTYSLGDNKATRFGEVRASNSLNSVFSPDGRWLAYTMRGSPGTSGGTSVYVQSFPYTDPGHQISEDDEFGHHPLWLPDGGILYFQGANALVARSVTTTTPVTFGNPVRVPGELVSNVSTTSPRNHDILPDGRILMVVDSSAQTTSRTSKPLQFEVVINWTEEVKRLFPTR